VARILVVDDDANTIGVLCATLIRAGYSVERASSGRAALEVLENGAAVDLLLTDVKMPDIDGFGLARMARSRRPTLRVIYISGNPAQVQLVDKAAKFGPVLAKTASGNDLLEAVKTALSEPPLPAA
jgi:CheY-like chemotaxis protein